MTIVMISRFWYYSFARTMESSRRTAWLVPVMYQCPTGHRQLVEFKAWRYEDTDGTERYLWEFRRFLDCIDLVPQSMYLHQWVKRKTESWAVVWAEHGLDFDAVLVPSSKGEQSVARRDGRPVNDNIHIRSEWSIDTRAASVVLALGRRREDGRAQARVLSVVGGDRGCLGAGLVYRGLAAELVRPRDVVQLPARWCWRHLGMGPALNSADRHLWNEYLGHRSCPERVNACRCVWGSEFARPLVVKSRLMEVFVMSSEPLGATSPGF